MSDDIDKLRELSDKYAQAKQEYREAKKTGDPKLIEQARKRRDNARKRFQGRLTL